MSDRLKRFWKDIIRIKRKDDCYDPTVIDGWIAKFIPNLSGPEPKIYERLEDQDIPD